MPNKNVRSLLNLRPTIFSTTVVRNLRDGSANGGAYQLQDSSLSTLTAIGESGSFRYDQYGTGLKSTQQLEVDWTDFRNHTFFNSAQVKVNAAFEKILNQFPIDGVQKEFERFFDGLTGFEKYVYDIFPKYQGYLYLNPISGTYVSVKDSAGATFPGITKNPNGGALLNPGLGSTTFETWLYLPSTSSLNSVIFQKLNVTGSNYYGFTMYTTTSPTPASASVGFTLNSGSYALDLTATLTASALVGKWNHLAVVWDRNPTEIRTKLYVNQQLMTQSAQIDIGYLDFDSANFYIGSGSAFPRSSSYQSIFTPTTTLSGAAIEEFRYWHSIRNAAQRAEFSVKNVYASDDLALYFKFNEPSGSLSRIVIDSSGKGLHGQLLGGVSVRNIATASLAGPSPVTFEKLSNCPALLPDYTPIETLRQEMLISASLYDQENPNLIVKLIPEHFFLEGQAQDALDTQDGTMPTDLSNSGTPNSTELGSTQILLMLLYTWATFLDEIKLYMDAFANSIHVDYDNSDTVASQFLQFLADKHGIQLPPMFAGTSIDQFINAENIDTDYSNNSYSLQYVQNQIWRRILINLRDVVSSKGTIHSVKSFIRSTGIDPDNNFRIREYGGPTSKALKVSRETRSEVSTMLDFVSGGYIASPPLSMSRVEPGLPLPAGTFINNSLGVPIATSDPNDGLLTSGSWTFEGSYILNGNFGNTQSLARMSVTGSFTKVTLLNLLAFNSGGLTLFVRPGGSETTMPLSLSLDANLYDGNMWSVSFGRNRGDEIGITSNSSSYFLRAAKQNYGSIVEEHVTSSYYDESNNSTFIIFDFWNQLADTVNASGSIIEIGRGDFGLISASSPTLADTIYVPSVAHFMDFNGKVSQLRFWSKGLTQTEWREHVRNFKSVGVIDPTTNFNFEQTKSGSFERLRLDVSTDQQVLTASAGGSLTLFDYSQNRFHMSGSSFLSGSTVIVPQTYYYSLISPHFDEAVTENKVRIRSFLDMDNALNYEDAHAQTAPVYEILPSEEPMDNTKFTIDFSIVESLDQDIINIFATLDAFDNAIGSPALLYSPDYPTLSVLRDLYFNRLTDTMNLKSLYDFYKWFDTNIGSFIAQLLPRKTRFNGTNFVVRSHMLERPKFEYQFYEQYMGDNVRHAQSDTILIQLFLSTLRKY